MASDHVLVVGGTRGLGKAVAERFLARGNTVSVMSRNASVEIANGRLLHAQADLETLTDASDVVARVINAAGPVRYVVFCQRFRGTGDPWAGELQVGLTATKLLVEELADYFCAEGDRAIGVASSVYADFVGGSQPAGYHVVKAGLNQLVRYYAWVMGRRGIRVNSVMPLTYVKPESEGYYRSKAALCDVYEQFVPLKRMGHADDSANLLDFLCSEKASFINGQCIYVDGGVSVLWPEELARTFSGV